MEVENTVDDIPTPTEMVEESSALPEDAVTHEPPPWAVELIAKVETLTDKVAELAPNPVAPLESLDDESDESPASLPWTHKTFF